MSESFSDDYVPNAEDNLSAMSDGEKSERSGQSDIDLDEINDVLLKNLESDVFSIQNEMKQKNFEMNKLLEELQEKFYAEKDSEYAKIMEDYEEKIKILQMKVDELENNSKNDREQRDKYFAVVEALENENDKLRDENSKQQAEIAFLNDKIQKLNNKSTTNVSGLINAPASPIARTNSHHQNNNNNNNNNNANADRNKNFVLELGEDYSTSDFDATGFLKSSDNLITQAMDDNYNKLELLREKLANEQSRNKELEFMIVTQKTIMENSNESMAKMQQENKDLEAKIEKLRNNVEKANQSRVAEKTKIDSVITFCELMDNCVFPKSELVEKLSEVPVMITGYLKGEIEVIAFNKVSTKNSKLVAAARKVKAIIEQIEEASETRGGGGGGKNYRDGNVASELDDIKHGLSNLTQFLSKAIPPNNSNNPNNQTRSNHHHHHQQHERSPDKDQMDRMNRMQEFKYSNYQNNDRNNMEQMQMRANNFKNSMFLARAMQNPSMLWNIPQNKQPGTRTSSEGRY